MPEDTHYSLSKYIETFTKIRRAAEQHSYLWNGIISEEGLGMLRVVIDEQQDWVESYGITKGKDGRLHFYKRDEDKNQGHLISIKDLSKDIQRHNNNGCKMSLDYLNTKFIGQLSEFLRRYETGASKVEDKVERKVHALEKMLF